MIVIQADEHVPQDVVTGLNARGIEAYSAYHEDLSGASDREVFEYAQRRNRTILTNDPDFFPLLEEGQHYGILYLTTQRAPAGRIIRDIARLIDTSRPEVFENNVFYLVAGLLKVCASFYPRAKRLCGPGRVVERHPNRGRQRVTRALRLNCGGAPVVTNPTDQLPPRT